MATLKQSDDGTGRARDFVKAMTNALPTPILVLDEKLDILSANAAFLETYGVSSDQCEGHGLYEAMSGAWNFPELRSVLGGVVGASAHFERLEVEAALGRLGKRSVRLSARAIATPTGERVVVLVAEDVTERRRIESERTRSLSTLAHKLRTPLSSLLLQSQLLQRAPADEARVRRAAETIERATKALAQLVDETIGTPRITTTREPSSPPAA